MVINSSSSIKSTSSSSDQPSADVGIRLAQELSDHLTILSADDRKKLIASFLDLVDDDSLALLSARVDVEKKCRKKSKDGSKSRARSQLHGGRETNGNSNSQLASVCSSSMQSMEVISESGSQTQSQTSPTAASRKTFAGFLRSKRDRGKANKPIKKDKDKSSSKSDAINDHNNDLEANSARDSNAEAVRVDEEGYVIRDTSNGEQRKETDNFYSDSDSSDEEDHKKPIHVIIKPINGSAAIKSSGSIAELRQTVKSLSISPLLAPGKCTSGTMRLKRRQVMNSSVALADECGPLKRSVSQHLYRSDASSFFPSNSHSVSNVFSPNTVINNRQFHEQTSSGSMNSGGDRVRGSISGPVPEDRYAALSSLFAESNATSNTESNSSYLTNSNNQRQQLFSSSQVSSPSNLSKSMSSSSVMGPPAPVIPKPPSKQQTTVSGFPSHSSALPHNNNFTVNTSNIPTSAFQNSMQRCKSYGSLTSSDLRMTPISLHSVGSSRGPSPLTIGLSDSVPLAAALQESISARFRGSDESRCEVQMLGSLKIAFPAGIVQALTNNPSPAALAFRITNSSRIDRIFPNQTILSWQDSLTAGRSEYKFEVKSDGLINCLRRSVEQSPNARYYYLDVLKYQLRCSAGVDSCPLQVVSHWKCEPCSTGLKIDYKYNPSALSSLEPLRNVCFSVMIDGNVTDAQGRPEPAWDPRTSQASWSFPLISQSSQDSGIGSLRAKFDVTNGPSKPAPVSIRFSCTDSTLSGIEFEILSPGYRLSLTKKQVVASRVSSEADSNISYAGV